MTMMNGREEEVMVCPGCRRHCPVNALSCERGEAYVKRTEAGEAEERMDHKEAAPRSGRHGHGREMGHEERGDGREGRDAGHDREGMGRKSDRYGRDAGYGRGTGHGRDGRDGRDARHGREERERHGHRDGAADGKRCHGDERGHWREMEDDSLLGLFHSCSRRLFHRAGQNRTQDKVVRVLAEHGEVTQKELRELLNIKPGSISELLSKLEAKGLILCEKDQEDRRKVVLRLTDHGMEYASATAQPEEDREMFQVLTEEEQGTVKTLLKKLLDSWS